MKTTAEMIEVMQAFERGEKIECKYLRGNDIWDVLPSPSWNWSECDYRIKAREPRVIWVNEYQYVDDTMHDTEEEARRDAGEGGAFRTAVKYIEVIE